MKRLAILFAALAIFAMAYTAASLRGTVNTSNVDKNTVAAAPVEKTANESTPDVPVVAETVKTEPTPNPAPEPAPAAPQRPVGCENYRALVSQYNWDVRTMMAVMQAENQACDPNRNNLSAGETHYGMDGNVICVGSYGLMQMGCLHFTDNQDGNDPATNIAVGYEIWKKQGYNAWTMYRNGEYKKFMR